MSIPGLEDWLETAQGCYVMAWESASMESVIADVFGFNGVAAHYPYLGSGILTRFPFSVRGHNRNCGTIRTAFAYILGSANPCPIAVHTEPFSTSVFKVLI